jgi:hypothetical protein
MISRQWRGLAKPDCSQAYADHLRGDLSEKNLEERGELDLNVFLAGRQAGLKEPAAITAGAARSPVPGFDGQRR